MSYSDERKGFSPASIGTVVAVHVAIGYAFISGLAYQVIHSGPVVTTAQLLPADPVPPEHMPPPPPQAHRSSTPPVAVERIVQVPLTQIDPVKIDNAPLVRPVFEDTPPAPSQIQPTPPSALARGAVPAGNRAEWVTNDDYPTAALRAEVEGSVGIDVTIDARGRVSDCIVTASSGSDLLDQATCRIYARRARFTPALNEAGQPVAAHRADRVRWQIPR
ncbi:TonB family protein [Sphingomonas sp. AP4-R1]|uniref:energy transducer TonB n=1 Tax=Sphingomonas sp. AP4-R1 TaxID=2735134 RepID=UPI0014938930|nr:energy transducer TonB [Sphingomonas sp. AP4-R1]QJU58594.1 TonB family protein [Sphingomonas sp. AP4-R1]